MSHPGNVNFQIQPVLCSTLPEVAGFLHSWHRSDSNRSSSRILAQESAPDIERRLSWLLIQNPAALRESPLGYCLRDGSGAIRGLNLCFPSLFVAGHKQLAALCSGSFFVEPPARSLGFYLFKKCLRLPGYSFFFSCSCNPSSSEIWKAFGARSVPNSEIEYILPIRLDSLLAAYITDRTASSGAARMARLCGRSVNPILRALRKSSPKLRVQSCHDWEKLSELSARHRAPGFVHPDRAPAVLEWRYGPASPAHPCGVYLLQDASGREGWFSLSRTTRGNRSPFPASLLLDAVWPLEKMPAKSVFDTIVRVAAETSDAVSFRGQPGLAARQYGAGVIPRKLAAPRAFFSVPKGAPPLPLGSLDYDDSESIAWLFPWRAA